MTERERMLAALTGEMETAAGKVPLTSGVYSRRDRLASWKARWGLGRGDLKIKPGLYALGSPSASSPVFATANYKLSFDALRTNLKTDAWLLVLDTRGINVWCAAGKGTFGTMELTRSLMESKLEKLVTHRTLMLPQLGAPGVAAHRVKAYTGFTVIYGPVRAKDIPEFIRLGNEATPEMRLVRFGFSERIILAPLELVYFGRYLLPVALLLHFFGAKNDALLTVFTLLSSTVLVPALLPWLPGRSFAVKSAAAGLLGMAAAFPFVHLGPLPLTARALLYVPAASFIGLQFTGSSTYTSLSGVMKEMRAALPAQAVCAAAGLLLLLGGILWR